MAIQSYGVPLLISSLLVAHSAGLPLGLRTTDQSGSGDADSLRETASEAFQRSDSDKDDKLSFDEFLHTNLLYEQLKRGEFDSMDENRDGAVSKEEYVSHILQDEEHADDSKAEYFEKLFGEFDANSDTKLSPEEVLSVLRKRFLVQPRDVLKFKELLEQFDRNGDGALDANEYARFDAELPFHEFEPVADAAVTPSISREIGAGQLDLDAENDNENHPHPILAFKSEKLPMMKSKQMTQKH